MREVYVISSETTKYINLLTQSLSILTEKEVDESKDRLVLLTSEGKPNPNLSFDTQELLRSLLQELTKYRKEWLISSSAFREIIPIG